MIGGTYTDTIYPCPERLDKKKWLAAVELSENEPSFVNFHNHIKENLEMWEMYFESDEP